MAPTFASKTNQTHPTQDADCVLLRERVESGTSTAQYLVRKRLESQDFLEIKSQMESLNATKSNNFQIYLISTNNL